MAEEKLPSVACTMPSYNSFHPLAALSYYRFGGRFGGRLEGMAIGSLLTQQFNQGWAMALNQHRLGNADYFLMQHADVEVQTPRYVEVMIAEMKRVGAAVLSAVVPIKDDSGDTSTAVDYRLSDNLVNVWGPRKLTLAECHAVGPTFDTPTVREYGRKLLGCKVETLLVNTGLMLIDLSRPEWLGVREEDGSLFFKFTILDRVYEGADGETLNVGCQSEDWVFSRRCAEYGVPVFATTKIAVVHHGDMGWSNQMDEVPQQEKVDVEV